MQVIPISFSLVASAISGSSMLGQSTEVYTYGLHNWIFLVFGLVRTILIHFIFLPVFYELQVVSSFMYLERRFDRTVRLFASAVYIFSGLFFIPLTIYVPSLTFQEVTGVNIYATAVIIMILCIWYTAVGGIKAVVWTDMFQLILMLASTLLVLCVGWYNVGGLENIWQAMDRGGRLVFFKLDFDLEARGTIWGYISSIMFISIYYIGMNQSSIQRYSSLPTLRKAKQSLWIQLVLYLIITLMELVIGAIMYTAYEDCDPYSIGRIKKVDQILPYFVQGRASLFPGFNGIFIAGIFAAGLSTTSTLLNTMSGTIYSDFIASRLKRITEEKANRILRVLVVVLGTIGTLMIFLIERMGTIFTITFRSLSILTSTIFGLFILGILIPRVNSKGVKYGVPISALVVLTLLIGSFKMKDPFLPMRTDGCLKDDNLKQLYQSRIISNTSVVNQQTDLPWVFKINYQYQTFIGLFLNISISYLVSIFTEKEEVRDQRLLATFMRKIIPQTPLLQNTNHRATAM
ncbi:sodium-coupled monocarboxylate transporter 2-like [Phlebotomus papatasi]|uniref:sodium-coupled monocarboxylate transporter 2-like n=1 Tax=Phlebotomus papatasi TaxID=29031 RepID=UPI0024842E16|nr:sodium-coupled monocarboxylate transporter 2-like [Phlebotomus papatasi]